MIQVQAPDGSIVEFPDGTADDVMAKAMRQTFGGPKEAPTFTSEATAVGASGVKGVASLLGLPGDILKGARWVGDQAAQLPGRAYNYMAGDGSFSMPQASQDASADEKANRPIDVIRGSSDIVRGIESVTGELPKPQTTIGQYAGTIAEFAPSAAISPGTVGQRLAMSLIPAVTSETAGQVTKGTAAEPYARLGGALAGGVGTAWAQSPSYANKMTARAAQDVTPQQFQAAEALMRDAQARGVTLTVDEAIQAATNGATRLGDVRRVVESTTEGGQRFAPVMAQRPEQMQQAVAAELNRISPTVARPYDVAPAVQEVGVEAMKAAERMRTRRASPYYRAAENETVNPNAVRAVVGEMDAAAAKDATGILSGPVNDARGLLIANPSTPATQGTRTPVLGPNGQTIRYEATPARPGTPETFVDDIGNLDRARKFLRDKTELPPFAAQAIPKEEGKVIGGLIGSLRDRMERNSRNFAQGRQQSETAARNIVEPMTVSPTGQLATASTPEAQRAILFPQNPLPNSQRAIGNAVESIANRDGDLARAVVRQELERTANKTVRGADTAARPDQFGGAKMARELRSNPQREANFLEAMDRAGVNPGPGSRLVDVLAATGWRQRQGSLTAFNKEAIDDLQRGGAQSIAQAIMKPLQTGKDTVARARLGSQAERLAEILLSGPDGVRRIEQIAAQGTGAQAALAKSLLTYSAASP